MTEASDSSNTNGPNDNQEARIYISKDDRPVVRSIIGPIGSAAIGAIIAAGAMIYVEAQSLNQEKEELEEMISSRRTEIREAEKNFNQSVKEFELDLKTRWREIVQNNIVDGFREMSFEEQQQAIFHILSFEDIDLLISTERSLRNGATIRAMQEIASEREDVRKRIEDSLTGVKRILFLDSVGGGGASDSTGGQSNVYCEDSRQTGRSNIDEIVELVRDLPAQIVGVKLNPSPHNDIEESTHIQFGRVMDIVTDSNLDVIVSHMDAFEGFNHESNEDNSSHLRDVISESIRNNPKVSIVLYSRGRSAEPFRRTLRNAHGSQPLIFALELDGGCLSEDSESGKKLEDAIRKAFHGSALYDLSFR